MISLFFLIPTIIVGFALGFVACYFRMTYNVDQG
jgi:hypothetical protein